MHVLIMAPLPANQMPMYRATAGIVLLAKSSHAAGAMVQAFRAKQVAKYYVALSGRRPNRKQGSVVGA